MHCGGEWQWPIANHATHGFCSIDPPGADEVGDNCELVDFPVSDVLSISGRGPLMALFQKIIDALSYHFGDTANVADHFEDFVLFGSVLETSVTPFDALTSDVDVAVVFSKACDSPLKRLDALDSFLRTKEAMENSLRKMLNRTDATERIISVLVVTETEHVFDICKADCPVFFSPAGGNSFYSLTSKAPRQFVPRLAGQLLPDLPIRNLISAIVAVQKARHAFVDVNSNGRASMAAYRDTKDAIPKSLIRFASVVSSCEQTRLPFIANPYDLNVGLQAIQHWVIDFARSDDRYREISELVSQRVGRGSRELTARDQMLLWEIVFEIAAALLVQLITNIEERAPLLGLNDCSHASTAEKVTGGQIVDDADDVTLSRCGICGKVLQRDVQHQLPFKMVNEVGSHALYCCETCFHRARIERWGHTTVLAYHMKHDNEQKVHCDVEIGLATIKVAKTLTAEDEESKRRICRVVASFLDISTDSVHIVAMEPGCTLVTVMLPAEAVARLTANGRSLPELTEQVNIALSRADDLEKEMRDGADRWKDGDLPGAVRCLVRADEICDFLGEVAIQAKIQCNLGMIREHQGLIEEAIHHHERALKLDQQTGYDRGIANHKLNLGRLHIVTGDVLIAKAMLIAARDLYASLSDQDMVTMAVQHLKDISEV